MAAHTTAAHLLDSPAFLVSVPLPLTPWTSADDRHGQFSWNSLGYVPNGIDHQDGRTTAARRITIPPP